MGTTWLSVQQDPEVPIPGLGEVLVKCAARHVRMSTSADSISQMNTLTAHKIYIYSLD